MKTMKEYIEIANFELASYSEEVSMRLQALTEGKGKSFKKKMVAQGHNMIREKKIYLII